MNPKFNKGAESLFLKSIKIISSSIGKFFVKIFSAFANFNSRERLIFISAIVVLVALLAIKGGDVYLSETELAPAKGGEYTEVIGGEAKYFTPILAKSDVEKTVSHIIYSSLIKIDENNQPQPDLATSWEISDDGLAYTFHLRQDVTFQKGQPLTSQDVAATINLINDENNKSPLRETWSNVSVETPDEYTVVFRLPKRYGPFIYACTNEIISQSDAVSGSLTNDYNGTGPYSFVSALTDGNDNTEIKLAANKSYFLGQPNISSLKFIVSKGLDRSKADKFFETDSSISAFANVSGGTNIFPDRSFSTGRSLVMFINLRNDLLKDVDLRRSLIGNSAISNPVNLSLVALDAEPQKSQAQEFAREREANGFDIDVKILNSNDYASAVKNRDYDLLMYGYDWSYDRDPYLFWHSSQIDKSNFDGYGDKASDITIEDARMIDNLDERNAKYREFYQTINDNALAIYFNPIKYSYYMSDEVKGTEIFSNSGRPEDRFNNITNWYIKEKRVKK